MSYDTQFWQSKISGYKQEDWSKHGSPFAKLVNSYIDDNSAILELGTGAGQDALWFYDNGHQVTASDGDEAVLKELTLQSEGAILTSVFDLAQDFPFEDASFDLVYAQLVLHYFTDEEMNRILAEVNRVLVPGGIIAIMVNTINDPEFDRSVANEQDMIYGKITKRYFSMQTLAPLVSCFDTLLFDEQGSTPKDDAVDTSGLVRFIGKKL